jgi:hypothetical protein
MENRNFGIIIVASPYDWLFTKGAISSCNFFMPGVPIQLIVDGRVDTSEAERSYQITVTRREDIEEPELRRLGFGWGTTKMLSFWYSQTEEFLYLDSDAVCWGDLRKKVDLSQCDYLVSLFGKRKPSTEEIRTWFFEPEFVSEHFPDWDWNSDSQFFFCPGVFAGRRNAFNRNEYLKLLRLNENNPGKFKFGDMGFHNLMVFRGKQLGKTRVNTEEFQVIFPEHPIESLKGRFAFDGLGNPIVSPGDEQVLHMPDQKPLLENPKCYSLPMTYFRLLYLRETAQITGQKAMEVLHNEDNAYHALRRKFLRSERRRKLAKLLSFHPGTWLQLLNKLTRIRGN